MKIHKGLAALTLLAAGSSVWAQSGRVDDVLGKMTLDEKLSFLSGSRDPRSLGQAGYLPGVPRLGVPPIRLTDGPAGIRVARPATALPAPVALAASFSPALARRFGQVLGREGRALEQDILLSPMTNIVRVPQAGRNFETFGEDPFLAASLVSAEVRGIQGEGLIATIKHYAANNFERDRMSVDVVVDERTLREIYLPAFEAAIQAGAGSVMGSYNKVNGTYACENPILLSSILRKEWGFPGFVMSDWFATHSAGPALDAGLDMEMPGSGMGNFGPPSYFAGPLKEAVAAGTVPQTSVDRAVRRILVSLDAVGLLDAPKPRPTLESIASDDANAAREIAIAGSVLLRNRKRILPLRREDLGSIVAIGMSAKVPTIGGAGSSGVAPLRKESPLDALARRAGSIPKFVAGVDLDGEPIPVSALKLDRGTTVDFVGARKLAEGKYAAEGELTAPADGEYALKLQVRGGTARLTLDGKPLIAAGMFFGGNDSLLPTADGLKNGTAIVRWRAGEKHRIGVSGSAGGSLPGMEAGAGALELRLAWVTPERRAKKLAEAVAAAKSARDPHRVRLRRRHGGLRPGLTRASRRPGRADRGGRGGEPAHRRRAKHRLLCHDALVGAHRRRSGDLVPRSGRGGGDGGDPLWRSRSGRPTSRHVPPPRGRRPDVAPRPLPWRRGKGPVLRRNLRRLPPLRCGQDRAALPVRPWVVVRQLPALRPCSNEVRGSLHHSQHRSARRHRRPPGLPRCVRGGGRPDGPTKARRLREPPPGAGPIENHHDSDRGAGARVLVGGEACLGSSDRRAAALRRFFVARPAAPSHASGELMRLLL